MSSPGVRLFLVRHGEVAANVDRRYLGARDDRLNERGLWQARELACALNALPIAAVYTSPLRRAAETAAAIAEGRHVPVYLDERLRETAYGEWEGLRRVEVLARGPEAAALLARWEADPSVAPPGGESLSATQARILALVDELAATKAGGPIVVVSHVGPIKALLCAALAVPLTAAGHMFLDPATISVVDWRTHPLVRLFNAHHHLGWEAARWMAEAP